MQHVCIEEPLLSPEGKIVNGPQQHAVVEDSRTKSRNRLARLEWIKSNGEAWSKIVQVANDAFVFVTETKGKRHVRVWMPVVLHKDPDIRVALGRLGQEILPDSG